MVWVMRAPLLVVFNDVWLRDIVVDLIRLDALKWFICPEPSNDLVVTDYLRVLNELPVVAIHLKTMCIPFPNELFLI